MGFSIREKRAMGFSIREKRAMGFNLREDGSTVYFLREQRTNVDLREQGARQRIIYNDPSNIIQICVG